ncbi:MAG: glycosyltransferase family 2 protein, partial [Elusimicrobia bacterium]|nr:glycosyltransferase family 2 protein [Elusimicrobiota bacterium]
MSAPFFSVVVPTYNRPRLAAAAVLSLLAQEERDWEAFVVDDGSTDATPEVLGRLPKDPRVTLLLEKHNRGQHVCRNRAAKMAGGKFLTFLDSDDLWLPARLKAFRRAAEARPGVGFWFSNAFVWRWDRAVGTLFDPARKVPEGRLPGHYAVGGRWLPYVTTNVAVSLEAFRRFGPFREDLRILEDTELYARMLAGGVEVGALPEPLSVRTIHEGQITREHARDYAEAVEALRSSGAAPAEFEERRRALALEVAGYMLKGLEPAKARAFLEAELGPAARATLLWKLSFTPRPVLAAARAARGLAARAAARV